MFRFRNRSKDDEDDDNDDDKHHDDDDDHKSRGRRSHQKSAGSSKAHRSHDKKEGGGRTLKQAALAGLPKFFTKEKARVITNSAIMLKSMKTWNVKMPPVKKHLVKSTGHFVPSVSLLNFRQHHRRLVLEIYGPPVVAADDHASKKGHSHNDHDDNRNINDDHNSITTPLKQGMMEELLEGGTPMAEDQLVLNDDDVVVIRILKKMSQEDQQDESQKSPSSPDPHRPPHQHEHHHRPDHDDDVSTLGQHAPGEEDSDDDDDGDGGRDKEYGSYRLEDVDLLKRHGRTCEMKATSGSNVVIRDFKFESEKHAIHFEQVLIRTKELDQQRILRKADTYRETHLKTTTSRKHGSSKSPPAARSRDIVGTPLPVKDDDDDSAMINILVEIVSATDLPVADVFSTDAYIKVRMGSVAVHRTKVISNNLNPIWTLETDSLFLLQMTPEEFFRCSNGMSFVVKDYDAVGSNEVLGRVVVSHNELLEGTGERLEYTIVPEDSTVATSYQKTTGKDKSSSSSAGGNVKYGKKTPKLYLRFKEATQDDIDFMETYSKHKGKVGMYSTETYLPPRPPDMKFLKRQTKWSSPHHNDNNGHETPKKELLHRVKPFPDPANEEGTRWLSKQELNDQALAHSSDWLESGSGDLGRLFVEVIRCDGLPNMDFGTLNPLDKTDAFCCLTFEDCVVNTDVIGDTFSPRWMPWSRRAFSFCIAHPQSNLIIGVFDYDPPNSPGQLVLRTIDSLHDPIGRCVVMVSRLIPSTEYTLTYPLFLGELDEHREKPRGTLTIRVRTEYFDKRKMLVAAMRPPPASLLSCPTKVDCELLDYTSHGADNINAFSIATFTRHIEELEEYQKILPHVIDAFYTVCFWRGHYRVRAFDRTIYLPVHSMVAFTWAILLCRDFDVFPSLMLFSIAWIFFATNEQRQQNPSPWSKVITYYQFWSALFTNRHHRERIEPYQNAEEVQAYHEELEKRKKQREKEREMAAKYEEELRKVLLDDIEEADANDVDITTASKSGFKDRFTPNLNPLKPVLYPIQLQLGQVVMGCRIAKNIILWAQTLFAVWIVTFSLVGAASIFFIPWGFLIGWTIRVALIVCFGPWMAIVDRYYFREDPNLTEEERYAAIRQKIQLRYESVTKAASDFQVKKERAVKLKSMKRYLYGKFIVKIPAFNTDKYVDNPLPESYARPYNEKTAPPINITGRKYGQILAGDMIPMREIQVVDSTKTDKKRSLVSMPNFKNPLKSVQAEKVPLLSTLTKLNWRRGYQAIPQTLAPSTIPVPDAPNDIVEAEENTSAAQEEI